MIELKLKQSWLSADAGTVIARVECKDVEGLPPITPRTIADGILTGLIDWDRPSRATPPKQTEPPPTPEAPIVDE